MVLPMLYNNKVLIYYLADADLKKERGKIDLYCSGSKNKLLGGDTNG